jgi:hypothetical protein
MKQFICCVFCPFATEGRALGMACGEGIIAPGGV